MDGTISSQTVQCAFKAVSSSQAGRVNFNFHTEICLQLRFCNFVSSRQGEISEMEIKAIMNFGS